MRKSDVAEVHNGNDLNMLTHVAERTGNMSSYPVEESPPCWRYVSSTSILDDFHLAGKNPATELLIWDHVNPYGRFELDMNTRLPLK